MKKVFLYAYDNVNLGDDLFILTIAKRYPNVRFYMWSNLINRCNFKDIKNIKILNKNAAYIKKIQSISPSIMARLKEILEKRCDAVVYIGGSLFIEYENWRAILNWWEYEALNRNFYVLGANFGPYHTEDYKLHLSKIFGKMKDICFRDCYSKQLFKEISTVRNAPDIIWDYPVPLKNNKKKQAFFSVIDCSIKNEGKSDLKYYNSVYMLQISDMIKKLYQTGWNIVISSFCKEEGDEEAVKNILSNLPMSDEIQVINYNGKNSAEIIDKIAESKLVIASRFHATILGFIAQCTVLPILYSNKTVNLLKDLGFSGTYIDIREMNQIDLYNIENIFTKEDEQKIKNIDQYKEQSRGHFKKLDELLK